MAVEYHVMDFEDCRSCTPYDKPSAHMTKLPPEILENIFQLIPVTTHRNLTRVCRRWRSIINEPSSRREVIVNLSGFEAAWCRQLGRLFASDVNEAGGAMQAYGSVLAVWITMYLDQSTRVLTLSGSLCDKAHIFWPSLVERLNRSYPRLRRINFQSGQVRLEVLERPPKSVVVTRLDSVRVIKRHLEEGYNEVILNAKQKPFVKINYRHLNQSVEAFLRL